MRHNLCNKPSNSTPSVLQYRPSKTYIYIVYDIKSRKNKTQVSTFCTIPSVYSKLDFNKNNSF